MPDTIEELYKSSKQAKIENQQRLNETADITQGKFNDPNLPFIAPDISGKAPSGVDVLSKYEGYMNSPEMVTTDSDINQMRASGQSGPEQIGNMAARLIPNVVMGTVSNLAAILDVEDYANMDDEVGNGVSQLMTEWQDQWKARNPIYRENPGTSFDVGDSGWWVDNISNLLDSAGAFAATGLITGGILSSITKGLGAGKLSVGTMNRIQKAIGKEVMAEEAATGAVLTKEAISAKYINAINNRVSTLGASATPMNAMALNQAESIMEGMGVYKDVYNQKLAAGDDVGSAKQKAADAAALDVNINRANIVLNLTSAGMFTNAYSGIKKAMGGAWKSVGLESGQEALEEGVNYVAQMEAMQQAKDGDNYKWDTDRALSHLGTAQGAEAMFLGAMGGGMQTGITHAIMSAKERAQSASNDLSNSPTAQQSGTVNKVDAMQSTNIALNTWFNEKLAATKPEDHAASDDKLFKTWAVNANKTGSLTSVIAEMGRIKAIDVNKEAETSGNPVNEIQAKKDLATVAFDRLSSIHNIAKKELLLPDGSKKFPLNEDEVLKNYIELDDVSRIKADAEQKHVASIASLTQLNQDKTPDEINNIDTPEKKFLDESTKKFDDTIAEIKRVTSDDHQNKLREDKRLADEAKKTAEDARKAAAVVANTPKPAQKPTVVGGVPLLRSLVLPNKAVAHDDAEPGKKVDIDDSELVTITGSNKIAALVYGANGKDMFVVTPAVEAQVTKDGEGQAPLAEPSRIRKIETTTKADGTIIPQATRAFKDLVDFGKNHPGISLHAAGVDFTADEFSEFLDANNTGESVSEVSHDTISTFLSTKQAVLAPVEGTGPIEHELEDVVEPDIIDSGIIDEFENNEEIEEDGTLRVNAAGVNSLVAPFTNEYVPTEEEGRVKKKKVNTGEINQDYLITSDKEVIKAGTEIIIKPYTGPPVDTFVYDESGRVKRDTAGNRITEKHNADTAKGKREIPIAIHLKKGDGTAGRIIGWLPEIAWLNEKVEGNDLKRAHIAESNINETERSIETVREFRQHITDRHVSGQKAEEISTIVTKTGNGQPFVHPDGYAAIEKAMPEILQDVKRNGGTTAFAHVVGSSIWSNGSSVNGIVNAKMFNGNRLNGSPVVLLPVGKGLFYAMPVKSKTVYQVSKANPQFILNGIKAFLNIGDPKRAERYDKATHSPNSITSFRGLKDYLESFIHIEYSGEAFLNPNTTERNAVAVFLNEDRNVILKYGLTSDSKPGEINLTKLRDKLVSADPAVVADADSQLEKFILFASSLRHNFRTKNILSGSAVYAITDTGATKRAANEEALYSTTLTTNARVAGETNGKNIYMIQPVVEIDVVSPLGKPVTPPVVENIPITPETPKEQTQAPKVERKTRRTLTKIDDDGDKGALLPSDDNKPLPSIASTSSGSDSTVRSRVFKGSDKITAREALDNIRESNPLLSPIIDALQNVMHKMDLDVEISLVLAKNISDNATGRYYPLQNRIDIAEFASFRGKNGLVDNTILHEIIHAITTNYVKQNPDSEHVIYLNKMYEKAIQFAMDDGGRSREGAISRYYGLTDVGEFLSEGFSDSEFIKLLMSIPSVGEKKFKNLFYQLYDWAIGLVSSIHGRKVGNDTLYKEFVSLSSEMMMARKNIIEDNAEFAANNDVNPDLPDSIFFQVFNSISNDVVTKIKNSDSDYLVRTTDGTILNTSEEDSGIGSIIFNFSERLRREDKQIKRDDVLRAARASLVSRGNSLMEKHSSGIDTLSDAELDTIESQYDSINRIIDKNAWNSLAKMAIRRMEEMGISVRADGVSNTNNVTEAGMTEDDTAADFNDDSKYDLGEDWNDNAMFSVGDMDTSTRAIKMMMWSLRDPISNSVGLWRMMDPEESYRRVLAVTSMSKSKDVDGIIESINDEAKIFDNFMPNNIFRQLYNLLSENNPNKVQTRIQFANAMNRNRNEFIMNWWNNGLSLLSTFNSNTKNADKVVLNNWKSFIGNAVYRNRDNIKDMFASASKHLKMARQAMVDNRDKTKTRLTPPELNAKIKSHIADSFSSIGIKLSNETYNLLFDPSIYNRKNGYKFQSGTTIEDQFFITSSNKAMGVFSALERAYEQVGGRDSIDLIFSRLNDASSALGFLANIESKTKNAYFATMSKGVDGNAHYSYGINTAQTNRLHRLLNDGNFLNTIRQSTYTRHASWLKSDNLGSINSLFRNIISIMYVDGISKQGSTKSTTRKKMTFGEDKLSRLSNFQNNGSKDTMLLWDTAKSDKHVMPIFQTLRLFVKDIVLATNDGPVIDRDRLINSEIMNDAMGIVRGDADRIYELLMAKSNPDYVSQLRNEYGEHFINNGQFFYGYKFLNKFFKFNEDLDFVPDAQIEIKSGVTVKASDLLLMNTDESIKFFKGKLADYFIGKANEEVSEWEKNNLVKRQSGKITQLPVNVKYASIYGLAEEKAESIPVENRKQAMMTLALDFQINSQIAVHNSMMLISGDPAQINKSVKGNIKKAFAVLTKQQVNAEGNSAIILGIDKSMAEYQKRLASDIAPSISVSTGVTLSDGTVLPSQYNVIFARDMKNNGAEYLKSLEKASGVTAEALSNDGSDALEFVTVQHKLDSLFRNGAISEADYLRIRKRYSDGLDLSPEDIGKLIIGAGKPLQTSTKFVKIGSSMFYKNIYIKSAEFPLIRQVTQTLLGPIDGVRDSMERNKVDRLIHVSAAKVGADRIVDIYNTTGDDKGNFIPVDQIDALFRDNKSQLDWSGFGYQQEMVYDPEHDEISMVTQADKMLFEGVEDLTFQYKGEPVSGSDLIERKHSVRSELSRLDNEELDKELGYNRETGTLDREKVLAVVEKNGPRLKWSPRDVNSTRLMIKNGLPLMFDAISAKVEAVIDSMFTNRGIKQKVPGGSLVQQAHLGRGIKRTNADTIRKTNGIILTDYYDPSTGLKMLKSDNGAVSYLEVMIPFKFWNNKQLLNVDDFVKLDERGNKTNIIDMTKVPEEFLRIVGLRIPNQGHSSQAMIRIVGFLPESMGDVIMVPPDITIQMGSDFDIDKLFVYWRNNFLSSDGNLVRMPDNIVEFDSDQDLMIDHNKLDKWRSETFKTAFKNRSDVNKFIESLEKKEEYERYIKSITAVTGSHGELQVDYNLVYSDVDRATRFNEVLKMFGLTEQDVYVPSINSLIKKAIQDSYFEIFESVLSHPAVIKKCMTPLDKIDLKQLAEETMSLDAMKEFGDPSRQAQDYISQSGAKSGVSIMSKVVVSLAMFENKDISFMKTVDGEVQDDHFEKFATHRGSTGKSTKIRLFTINPRAASKFKNAIGEFLKRTAIDNVTTVQSGSVDNAKDPVLHPNNLNSNTFGVSAVLSAMSSDKGKGVGLQTNARFLRQEAIVKLTKELDDARGIIAEYTEMTDGRLVHIANDLKAEYRKKFSNDAVLNEELESIKDKAYSPEDLLELENMQDKNSVEYIASQIDMIDMFVELDRRAWLFSDATGMLTLDSNGIGINYWENQNILFRLMKAVQSKSLRNVGKLWSRDGTMSLHRDGDSYYVGEEDSSDKVNPSGNNVKIAVKAHEAMGKLMGYENEFLNSVIYNIERAKGFDENVISNAAMKLRKSITNGFKSFIYSKMPMVGNLNLTELINDGSIARQLVELKNNPELSANLYIQSLQVQDDKYITIDARIIDGSAANNVIRGFYELAMSDNDSFRDFAENMIKYELLTGGIQGPNNSLKYISPEIMESLGYHDQIKTILSDPTTNNSIAEFVQKFFANNPNEAIFINKTTAITKGEGLRIESDKTSAKYAGDKIIRDVTRPIQDGLVFREYLRTGHGNGVQLYKLISTDPAGTFAEYVRIPLRGSAAINNSKVPMFTDYTGTIEEIVKPTLVEPGTTKEYKPLQSSVEYSLENDIPDGTKLSDLSKLFQESTDNVTVWTGGLLEVLKSQIGDIPVVYTNDKPKQKSTASYNPKSRVITIYRNEMRTATNIRGPKYAFETLLHEINHAMMEEVYVLGQNGHPLFREVFENTNAIFSDAVNAVKTMPIFGRDGYVLEVLDKNGEASGLYYGYFLDRLHGAKNKINEIEKIVDEVFPGSKNAADGNDLRVALYSFSDAHEFMADLASNPKFQEAMSRVMISDDTASKLKINEKKSIVRAFFEMFAKLFTKLNRVSMFNETDGEVSQTSILEASFINSMILVNKKLDDSFSGINNDLYSQRPIAKPISPVTDVKIIPVKPVIDNNSTFTFANGFEVTLPFELNVEQKSALSSLENFINDKKQSKITLSGYAGTGKTTIISILDKYLNQRYLYPIYSSPTHRANAVTKLKNPNAKVITLHKAFGLSPDLVLEDGDYDIKDLEFSRKNKPLISHGDLLIIDESSMVNDALYKFVEDVIKTKNVKVIYIGDKGQIKPVKQDHISKVFTENTENEIMLTEVMRTSNNSILEESTNLRNNKPLNFQTKLANGIGVVYYNARNLLNQLINEEFTKQMKSGNGLYIRILSGTNAMAIEFNNAVRRVLFNNPGQLEVGDLLMGYKNFDVDYNTGEPKIINGGDYKVESVTPGTQTIKDMTFSGYRIVLSNALDPNDSNKDLFVVSKTEDKNKILKFAGTIASLNKLAASYPKGSKDAALLFKEAKELENKLAFMLNVADEGGKDKIVRTVDYGYAHTIHKSQGGTYEKVIFLEQTMDKFKDAELRKQLEYVAMSRAVKNVYVLTDEVLKQPIITNDNESISEAKKSIGLEKEVNKSATLTGTIAEFLRKSNKNVRFAFRKALADGVFTTKC